MYKKRFAFPVIILIMLLLIVGGCHQNAEHTSSHNGTSKKEENGKEKTRPPNKEKKENKGVEVVSQPESINVLVNKHYKLPPGYKPKDLIYVNVPFIFKEKIEKRKMRKEAAGALVKLFDGAKSDGIYLAGVSAFRSYSTQQAVFSNYVQRDGEEKAKTYSALPGTSEHQTGLAIDVSGRDGKCAATDCFSDTKEAKWLSKNAFKYGFILRYPKGKENITGYKYESWHIRYVGKKIAKEVVSQGITLEEYYNATPVNGK